MASKIAKAFLASLAGTPILSKPHTGTELGNFAAGQGNKAYSLPFHIVRMDSRTGDSKTTVGWARTLSDARRDARAMKYGTVEDGTDYGTTHGGAESHRNPYYTYYVRDIRNGNVYRI
jgi:hypothetical protein